MYIADINSELVTKVNQCATDYECQSFFKLKFFRNRQYFPPDGKYIHLLTIVKNITPSVYVYIQKHGRTTFYTFKVGDYYVSRCCVIHLHVIDGVPNDLHFPIICFYILRIKAKSKFIFMLA
jgi:hypothetical protein